jgi:hypothetical protein
MIGAELANIEESVLAVVKAAAATVAAIVAVVFALFTEDKLLATDESSLSEVIEPAVILFAVIFAMVYYL